ncbi:MAG: polysaccharide biosynthesis protein [Desulfomicrobium sp.]|nr:polysaccharide biosynthesis protein [Pseudomonadota bacterium]MBV1713005.1 polysaccharide biosynthesis protein [Desulfomicrobium sp.]MBU4571975.1 polysaccharide biosynthesis protein [Pseudomonadota bacterium]MBU4596124.1 polysaccharide biosynthesis protein [Pseudomonadota bacterium]MBV1721428.1 polysaccharide biosynthesis protein [Desulfomicrobium sp.]
MNFWCNKNLYLMLLGESGLFALALILAYGLRFEFEISPEFFLQMLRMMPAAVGLKLAFFWVCGLYRGMWRYTGLADLWKIGRAVFMAEVALIIYVAFTSHFQGHPRSVFILDPLLAFVFACGARVLIRSLYEASAQPKDWLFALLPERFCAPALGIRALIVGADDDGARIAKEILEVRDSGLLLVGFVDDDPVRIGRNIHGLPVYGPLAALVSVAQMTRAEEILVSAGQAGGHLREIVDACEAAQLRIKKLPALADIASGKVSVKALRDVRYEDLLGREEVHLDEAGIKGYLEDKVVLVSGAGGSIGSELCRQIIRFNPRLLVLFDAGEENLYSIEMELLHQHGFTRYVTVLGQVQDAALVDTVFAARQPQVVFHAAAYKHVPMLECNPWQAVTNNILGSRTVMEASVRHGVRRFVLVSTDKAVRPTNVMGASKRVAELLMHGFQGAGTTFMAVRFGNVLGSSGSVIPLFRSQIERGGPVTVTHPEVTRYFMTIPEAAQLIVQAGALGQGGEIFVLKMGQPVRIAELARDLIVLSGKDPSEIEIKFTGLRPGEKLYEELITAGEDVLETGHDKIMVLRSGRDGVGQDETLDALFEATRRFDVDGVRRELESLVPEYSPANDASE